MQQQPLSPSLQCRVERERQIDLPHVKMEAARKHEHQDLTKARADAQAAVEQVTTRARVQVAGEFGEKRFLVRLEELVGDRPYDVVNLRQAPTVKGARAKSPCFMAFEVTSETQDDVEPFLIEVRELRRDTSLVLVSTTRL